MPRLATSYFLNLADSARVLVRYESLAGAAYLANSPDIAKAVLSQSTAFAGSSHPFRKLAPLLSPPGSAWLGIDATAARADALIHQAQNFFDTYTGLHCCDRSAATGELSSADFYFELKAMFFALSANLLFDIDLGASALDAAHASDTIEELRARFGAGPDPEQHRVLYLRKQSAQTILRQIAERIQVHRGHDPADDLSRAIEETLLNAAVPMAYGFIWTLLVLGRHDGAQSAVHSSAAPPYDDMAAGSARRVGPAAAVIKEVLRLYPPVWAMGRTCTHAQSLAGIAIPLGAPVVVSPYAMHRLRRFWERPGRFDPRRFQQRLTRNNVFLPFGAGTRTCPAARWNVPLLVAAVHSFLGRYVIHTDRLPRVRPLVALRPALGFSVSLCAR